jgi:uncharacterized phage-like protein YoqJ
MTRDELRAKIQQLQGHEMSNNAFKKLKKEELEQMLNNLTPDETAEPKEVHKPTICFTGRRPKNLWGYEKNNYVGLVNQLKEVLKTLHSVGYVRCISGGAQGFDQIAFWAVNALKREGYYFENVVYVPFRGQSSVWKAEGLFSQKEYNLMLGLADEVVYVGEKTSEEKSEITKLLHNRNHAMVDDSDFIIGLYPDKSWEKADKPSGTAECLRYAKEQNKRILQIAPQTLTII